MTHRMEACIDCVMVIANGEVAEDYDARGLEDWSKDYILVVGDEAGFSMSTCEVCGSRLGGDRHIVTAIPKEDS